MKKALLIFAMFLPFIGTANTNGICYITVNGPFNGGGGGNATNALISGPAGIYDASLVTNLQGAAVIGTVTTAGASAIATNSPNGTALNTLEPTNDTTWFDGKGAAQAATNTLGTAAFQTTGTFDLSGVGATKAQQATNGFSNWTVAAATTATTAGTATNAQQVGNALFPVSTNISPTVITTLNQNVITFPQGATNFLGAGSGLVFTWSQTAHAMTNGGGSGLYFDYIGASWTITNSAFPTQSAPQAVTDSQADPLTTTNGWDGPGGSGPFYYTAAYSVAYVYTNLLAVPYYQLGSASTPVAKNFYYRCSGYTTSGVNTTNIIAYDSLNGTNLWLQEQPMNIPGLGTNDALRDPSWLVLSNQLLVCWFNSSKTNAYTTYKGIGFSSSADGYNWTPAQFFNPSNPIAGTNWCMLTWGPHWVVDATNGVHIIVSVPTNNATFVLGENRFGALLFDVVPFTTNCSNFRFIPLDDKNNHGGVLNSVAVDCSIHYKNGLYYLIDAQYEYVSSQLDSGYTFLNDMNYHEGGQWFDSSDGYTYWLGTELGVWVGRSPSTDLTNWFTVPATAPTLSHQGTILLTAFPTMPFWLPWATNSPTAGPIVSLSNNQISFGNTYNGNGGGLTNYAASNLVSGGQIPAGTLFDSRTNADMNSNAYVLFLDANSGKRFATTDLRAFTNLNPSGLSAGNFPSAITNNLNGSLAADTNSLASLKQSAAIATSAQNKVLTKASCTWATAAGLPTYVYANGSSGAGATITGVSVGGLTVDGFSVATGDSVLVKNEATAATNGIYTVTTPGSGILVYVLTRRTDFDQASDLSQGDTVAVVQGTANTNSFWQMNSAGPFTIGTTSLNFVKTAGPITLTGDVSGNGVGSISTVVSNVNLGAIGTNGPVGSVNGYTLMVTNNNGIGLPGVVPVPMPGAGASMPLVAYSVSALVRNIGGGSGGTSGLATPPFGSVNSAILWSTTDDVVMRSTLASLGAHMAITNMIIAVADDTLGTAQLSTTNFGLNVFTNGGQSAFSIVLTSNGSMTDTNSGTQSLRFAPADKLSFQLTNTVIRTLDVKINYQVMPVP